MLIADSSFNDQTVNRWLIHVDLLRVFDQAATTSNETTDVHVLRGAHVSASSGTIQVDACCLRACKSIVTDFNAAKTVDNEIQPSVHIKIYDE
ncbi:MAG: hypothetical protein F9K28_10880, partial [Bacteroidetes bacterium]